MMTTIDPVYPPSADIGLFRDQQSVYFTFNKVGRETLSFLVAVMLIPSYQTRDTDTASRMPPAMQSRARRQADSKWNNWRV